jgi:predicted acetyltransferase
LGEVADSPEFKFLEPGVLIDGQLELVVVRQRKPGPAKDWVAAYDFEMRMAGSTTRVGTVSFRAQSHRLLDLYRGQIGYGVDLGYRGRHFAERSVRLLFPFIRRHGFSEIWITCNPDNKASRRTLERLGGTLVEIVKLPETEEMFAKGDRTKCRFRIGL